MRSSDRVWVRNDEIPSGFAADKHHSNGADQPLIRKFGKWSQAVTFARYVFRLDPVPKRRAIGIRYPIPKYFIAARTSRLRIARIAYFHGGTRDFQNKFRNTAERRCDAKTKFKIKTGAGHHPVRLISITTANSRLLGDRETTAPKVPVSTLSL